jgi:hypothetical protein
MLETACRDFEVLQRVVRQEVKVVAADGQHDARAAGAVTMALAKSFVFHVMRARRICDHGAGSLNVDRMERKRFLAATRDVVDVRDVNEHGFDVVGRSGDQPSRPSMHEHPGVLLDETSLVVLSDKNILMGRLNLYNLYLPTARMQTLAGFAGRKVPGFLKSPAESLNARSPPIRTSDGPPTSEAS